MEWLGPRVPGTKLDHGIIDAEGWRGRTGQTAEEWGGGRRWRGWEGQDRTEGLPQKSGSCIKSPSMVLCFTEIKCPGTGQFSNLPLIVLLTAWLYCWFLNVVNAKKIRHHKMKARF